MDKLVNNIVILSGNFDDAIQINDFNTASKLLNDIKQIYSELKLSNVYISLVEKLYNLNNREFEILTKKQNTNLTNTQDENTLIVFYKKNCKASNIFLNNDIKILKNKINILRISCENTKEKQSMCNYFNVYEYPAIRFIKNGKIMEYYGKLDAQSILKEFNL